MGKWSLDSSPAYIFTDLMSRLLSPYDLNPLGFNPLREILTESGANLPALVLLAEIIDEEQGHIYREGA